LGSSSKSSKNSIYYKVEVLNIKDFHALQTPFIAHEIFSFSKLFLKIMYYNKNENNQT